MSIYHTYAFIIRVDLFSHRSRQPAAHLVVLVQEMQTPTSHSSLHPHHLLVVRRGPYRLIIVISGGKSHHHVAEYWDARNNAENMFWCTGSSRTPPVPAHCQYICCYPCLSRVISAAQIGFKLRARFPKLTRRHLVHMFP